MGGLLRQAARMFFGGANAVKKAFWFRLVSLAAFVMLLAFSCAMAEEAACPVQAPSAIDTFATQWQLFSGEAVEYRLTLQVDPEAGSDLDVYVRYDGGPWEHCANLRGQGLGRHLLRLLPHRCQHFALELRGRGACRVLSLGMVLEEGSESL